MEITKRFQIHIINGFPNNSHPLEFRCQSKDTDFGDKQLNVGDEFYWEFHVQFFRRTLYFCHFYWGDHLDKVFDVFNDKKMFPNCDNVMNKDHDCYWLVKDDGFYFSKFSSFGFQKTYSWT